MIPEPVASTPPPDVRRPLTTQVWRDVTFLHWPYDPVHLRQLLPSGVEPDTEDGTAWVGVVGLRMTRVRVVGVPPPYLGELLETNVRTYSVDENGRRGVVFLAMEASRLGLVLGARGATRLPYHWATMDVRREDAVLDYTTLRRWPGSKGPGLHFRVTAGDRIEGTTLDRFLVDRWGLHVPGPGRPWYFPLTHEPWSLRSANLLHIEDGGLLAAAGLPPPAGPPSHVLYAPVAHARIGPPARVR